MDWTLEVVVVPVTDVDRAKMFYTEKLAFNVDVDTNVGDSFRVVQLTPPGSSCSITIGPLVVDDVPAASARLQLCVLDIEQARAPDGNNWAVQEVPAVRPTLQRQAEQTESS